MHYEHYCVRNSHILFTEIEKEYTSFLDYVYLIHHFYLFFFRELSSVGVKNITSEGGYYFMPDFAVCKDGLAKKGITNGKEMCNLLLEEFAVAVSFTFDCYVRYHFYK